MFRRALASGLPLTGEGQTYAISGDFEIPDALRLEYVTFKQMAPDHPRRRTLTKTGGHGPIRFKGVVIDRNGSPRHGSGDAAGIHFAGVDGPIDLEDCEVFGHSKGHGMRISLCRDVALVRPYVHDMRWAADSDPGTEQILGLWCDRISTLTINTPRIRNLDGQVGNNPPRAYLTDGLTLGGCSNWTVIGGHISDVGEGLDATGSFSNEFFSILGLQVTRADAWGIKLANSARHGNIAACIVRDAGLGAFVASGAAEAGLVNTEHLMFQGCRGINTGSNGYWTRFHIAAFQVLEGRFGAPRHIHHSECDAIDEQSDRTQKFGYRNEKGMDVTYHNARTYGALIGDFLDG